MQAKRDKAFGQDHALTIVDRFGTWLSERQITRWTRLEGKAVGDFGCGYAARLSARFSDKVQALWLVDVALDPALASRPNTRCVVGSLPDAAQQVPTGALDVAMCVSVLEHLHDRRGMLKQLHRATKPGGIVLINVPSWRGKTFLELSAFRLGMSPKAEMDDHKIYYDVKDLWPELVAAGFLPSHIRCFSHKLGLNTFAVCER